MVMQDIPAKEQWRLEAEELGERVKVLTDALVSVTGAVTVGEARKIARKALRRSL